MDKYLCLINRYIYIHIQISREQVQKLTPQCLLYIHGPYMYNGYRFPLSLSTIWGNHLGYKFVLSIFIYNIALRQKYFRSHLSIFLFPFSFHLGRGTPPPCPTPVLRVSNNEYLFLQFCSYKFVLPIFIQYIALQNTDFGVLQKSSKHFLISIFFPLGEGDTPSLSHPR